MNELKPEDVMRALGVFASLNNCNNSRYLEGCGHFCRIFREPIDDMASGRSPKCNEHCEYYTPPRIEEVCRAALALLKKYQAENAEKDAEIERLTKERDKAQAICVEMGRLNQAEIAIARAEAIDEFADRLKATLIAGGIYPVLVKNAIEKIAKELKGEA